MKWPSRHIPLPSHNLLGSIVLDFGAGCGQIAGHENRQHDLHYRLHHYPLGIAGGAVFFIPTIQARRAPLPARNLCGIEGDHYGFGDQQIAVLQHADA
jgi:hypothetical protein